MRAERICGQRWGVQCKDCILCQKAHFCGLGPSQTRDSDGGAAPDRVTRGTVTSRRVTVTVTCPARCSGTRKTVPGGGPSERCTPDSEAASSPLRP